MAISALSILWRPATLLSSGLLLLMSIQAQAADPTAGLLTMNSVLLAGTMGLIAWSIVSSRRTDKKIDTLVATMFGTSMEGGKGGMKGDFARMEIDLKDNIRQLQLEILGLRKSRHESANNLQEIVNRQDSKIQEALNLASRLQDIVGRQDQMIQDVLRRPHKWEQGQR